MNEELNRYILNILKPTLTLEHTFGRSSSVFSFNYNKDASQPFKPQQSSEPLFIGSAVFNWDNKFHDNRFFNRNYLSSISIPSYLEYLKTIPYDLESLATESRLLTTINNKDTIGKFRITVNKPIGLINLNFYSLAQLILNQREIQTLNAVVDDYVVSELDITYNVFYQFNFSYSETEDFLGSVLGGLPSSLNGNPPAAPSSVHPVFSGFLRGFTVLNVRAWTTADQRGTLTGFHDLVYKYRIIHPPSFSLYGSHYYLTFGYTDCIFYRYNLHRKVQSMQSDIGSFVGVFGSYCEITNVAPLYYFVGSNSLTPAQFDDFIETGVLNGNYFGGGSVGDRSAMAPNENENHSSCYSKHVLPPSDPANPFVNSPFLSSNHAANIDNLSKPWLGMPFGVVVRRSYLCYRPDYAGGNYTANFDFIVSEGGYSKETFYKVEYKLSLNPSSSFGSGSSFSSSTVGLDNFKNENNNDSKIEETEDYSEGIFWFYNKHRKNVYNILTNILDHYSPFKNSTISVSTGVSTKNNLKYSKVNNYLVPQCSYLIAFPLVFKAANLIMFFNNSSEELSTPALPNINGNTVISSLLCFYYRSPFDNNVSLNFPFSEDSLNKLRSTECRLPDRTISLNCVLYLGDVKKVKIQDLPYIDVNLQKPKYTVDIFECINLGTMSIEYKNYIVSDTNITVDKIRTKTNLFKSFDLDFLDVNVFDVSNFKFYLHEFLYKFFKLSKLWAFCSSEQNLSLINIKSAHRKAIQQARKNWKTIFTKKPELNTLCVTLPFSNALKKENIQDYIKIDPLLVGVKMTSTFKDIYEQNTVINVIDNF